MQVIIVDNASIDESKDYFQNIEWIEYYYLNSNLGFGKANNIGIEKAKGKYTLLLNPDTILNPDTLSKMYQNMEEDEDVWCGGARVLNTDGTFQIACRRGLPTPWNAFSKLFGLQSLFPKVKLFSDYNKLYLSDKKEYDIDALIGAFMFFRTDKLMELKGFDEAFFMYGEDLDLCKRVWDIGGRIRYFPQPELIHHKGESTLRSDINHVHRFYEAMEIYSKKHFGGSKSMSVMLKFAIWFRSLFAWIDRFKKDLLIYAIDFILLFASSLFATFYVKGEIFNFPEWAYPDVFIALAVVQFLSFMAFGVYLENPSSPTRTIPAMLFSFLLLSTLTYYFNEYAFSRGVILLTMLTGGSILFIYRFIFLKQIRSNKKDESIFTQQKSIDKGLLKNLARVKGYELIFDSENLGKGRKIEISSRSDLNYIKTISSLLFDKPLFDESKSFNINLPRYRAAKRLIDIIGGILMLSILLPFSIVKNNIKFSFRILFGKSTLVGTIPTENHKFAFNKSCLYNPISAFTDNTVSNELADEINRIYLQEYTPLKDLQILIENLARNK
ncbi:MAG: hypothetical protein Kapaf2KO_05030 [Candidatus Kapaibacteriales bacterium]